MTEKKERKYSRKLCGLFRGFGAISAAAEITPSPWGDEMASLKCRNGRENE
jgi:hypothetical protein